MRFDLIATCVAAAALFLLGTSLAVGWVLNIFKLVGGDLSGAGELIVRVVGIVIPMVGGIAGFF